MLIKLVEQHEKTEDEKVENIYEEIIPREKKVGRSNSFFFSISQGRREQMELYKFTGWNMEEDMNKMDKADKVEIIST